MTMLTVDSGKDKYGAYITVNGFRSAMPDTETAERVKLAIREYEAIERAARDLTNGCQIEILVEQGCGSVKLSTWDDEWIVGGGDSMADDIESAIEEALDEANKWSERLRR